jgi:hypothetical protein
MEKNNLIKELKRANEWFKMHDIQSFIDDDNSLYIVVGDGFEIQLSPSEVSYRAQLFETYINNN